MSEQDKMRVKMGLIATDKIIAIFKKHPELINGTEGKEILERTKLALDKMIAQKGNQNE